jgi:hypothetical protein
MTIIKILKIILYVIIGILLLAIMLSTILPYTSKAEKILDKDEVIQMIEYAKDSNITAMRKLGYHYFFNNHNKAMFLFYEIKLKEIELLSYKEELENYKKDFEIEFDDNISKIADFVKICGMDDFCKASDEYKFYKGKLDNLKKEDVSKNDF